MESAKFTLLRGAAEQLEERPPEAARLLRQLESSLDWGQDLNDLTYAIFAQSLALRVRQAAPGRTNMYLRPYTVPQLHLFNLLATRVPQVYLASEVANQLLLGHMAGAAELCVVDIGIGTGRQMEELLRRMAARRLQPERLTLVGIEPDQAALAQAQQHVRQTAAELGLNVDFLPLCTPVETLTKGDWHCLHSLPGRLLVNESFSLHHVGRREGQELRQQVLERLRELAPEALVLSEPNVDHLTPDRRQRFFNCWEHFWLTFQSLDEIGLSVEDNKGLKAGFFRREIEDILGYSEEKRSERHETAAMWRERLVRAGFRLELKEDSLAGVECNRHPVCVAPHEDHVGLDYRGRTLISVLHATANAAT